MSTMGIASAHLAPTPGSVPPAGRLRRRIQRVLAPIAAVVLAGALSGCSLQSDALLQTHTMEVLINGQDTGQHVVRCQQVQWLWNIETLKKDPGVSAQVQTGDTVVAKSVQINNLAGFTGSFWELTTGHAHASVDRRTFTIGGTAEGFYHDHPGARSTATFELTTDC
jgi:ipoprotein LpqH